MTTFEYEMYNVIDEDDNFIDSDNSYRAAQEFAQIKADETGKPFRVQVEIVKTTRYVKCTLKPTPKAEA